MLDEFLPDDLSYGFCFLIVRGKSLSVFCEMVSYYENIFKTAFAAFQFQVVYADEL